MSAIYSTNPRGSWINVWVLPFTDTISCVTGKRIWGRACMRMHQFMIDGDHSKHVTTYSWVRQYATRKEAFELTLKGK